MMLQPRCVPIGKAATSYDFTLCLAGAVYDFAEGAGCRVDGGPLDKSRDHAGSSLREAAHKVMHVTDWHTATIAQSALASFIDEGGFACHIRRVSRTYSERHEMLRAEIKRSFGDHLELIPSSTGLRIAAYARSASVDRIDAIASRAFDLGVAI